MKGKNEEQAQEPADEIAEKVANGGEKNDHCDTDIDESGEDEGSSTDDSFCPIQTAWECLEVARSICDELVDYIPQRSSAATNKFKPLLASLSRCSFLLVTTILCFMRFVIIGLR